MSRLVYSVSLVSLYMYVKGERQSVQVTTELLNRSPPLLQARMSVCSAYACTSTHAYMHSHTVWFCQVSQKECLCSCFVLGMNGGWWRREDAILQQVYTNRTSLQLESHFTWETRGACISMYNVELGCIDNQISYWYQLNRLISLLANYITTMLRNVCV